MVDIEGRREIIAFDRRSQKWMITFVAILEMCLSKDVFPVLPAIVAVVYAFIGFWLSRKTTYVFTTDVAQLEKQRANIEQLSHISSIPDHLFKVSLMNSYRIGGSELVLPLVIIQLLGLYAQHTWENNQKQEHLQLVHILKDNLKHILNLADFEITVAITNNDWIKIDIIYSRKNTKPQLKIDISHLVANLLTNLLFAALQKKCTIIASAGTVYVILSLQDPVTPNVVSTQLLAKSLNSFSSQVKKLLAVSNKIEQCIILLFSVNDKLIMRKIAWDGASPTAVISVTFNNSVVALNLPANDAVYQIENECTICVNDVEKFLNILKQKCVPQSRTPASDASNASNIVVATRGVILRSEQLSLVQSVVVNPFRWLVERGQRYSLSSPLFSKAAPALTESPAQLISFGSYGTYDPADPHGEIIKVGIDVGVTYYIRVDSSISPKVNTKLLYFIDSNRKTGMNIGHGPHAVQNGFILNPALCVKGSYAVLLSKIKYPCDDRLYAIQEVQKLVGGERHVLHLMDNVKNHEAFVAQGKHQPTQQQKVILENNEEWEKTEQEFKF